jgi:DNA polymerase III delta prime subunit
MTDVSEQVLFIDKYKPVYLKDFEMDNKLYDFLKTMIDIDNLNLLLIGSSGCGKTTILNSIIRDYYNGYNEKEYMESVLSINNLREQGINYYRNEVKTFCQSKSLINGKKKIILLDDIDLINEQSQQVFRNYIDKYSHNVHFISSCYNIQKVIENLQSRLIIIKINPLSRENILKIINNIKLRENIVIDEDAEEFILNICNNTVKIFINYMEKFKLLNMRITLDLVNKMCTNINFESFKLYTEYIKNNELNKALDIIYSIYDKGYSVMDILDNYFFFIKITDILNEGEKYDYIPIICKYITIFHSIHEDEIELALFTNSLLLLSK